MTTALEYFEKQVKEHTESLDVRTKDTGLIWDLWCALQEAHGEIKEVDRLRETNAILGGDMTILRAEYDTLKDAYLRLMKGVEEKMQHRQPKLGPLGMGSAEGIKDQAGIYERTPVTGEIRGNLLYDGAVWVPIPHVSAPDEWFVWAIDRLRQDSKDGNFHRSYRFAQELLKAIDERGCAIVPKTELEKLRADNDKLHARMKRIAELNKENLADIDDLLARRRP